MKYIFVCGCTISGIGKGTFVYNLAILLKNCGYTVTAMKIDPYFNQDAGTMNPYEHGETFVLDDGGETDLDLGNYERAIPVRLTSKHNLTSGKLYQSVLEGERKGEYLGKTVQMIPHVTFSMTKWIEETAKIKVQLNDPDKENEICLIEIGGTVGDYESGVYLEGLRMFLRKDLEDKGVSNCLIILMTWIPEIGEDRIHKTKPTQHGIRDLKSAGIFPNLVVCRSESPLFDNHRLKLSYWAAVPLNCIISCYNTQVYNIINVLFDCKLHEIVLNKLNLPFKECDIGKYRKLYHLDKQLKLPKNKLKSVKIGILGKYTLNTECYHSVQNALNHAALACNLVLKLVWIEAANFPENLTTFDSPDVTRYKLEMEEIKRKVDRCDGLLVPGGNGYY